VAKKNESGTLVSEWTVGQPLLFPSKKAQGGIRHVARQALEEGLSGPFRKKRAKRKRK